MNENLFNVKIIVLNSTHNTRRSTHNTRFDPSVSMHQQVPCTRKTWYSWDHGVLRAVNSLQL